MKEGLAPLRLGLAGGGTDCPPYRDMYGGATLGFTIDKYVHVKYHESPSMPAPFVMVYQPDLKQVEMFGVPVQQDVTLFSATFKELGLSTGADIVVRSDLVGSGLGTSSAILVAFLTHFYQDKQQIVDIACKIEEEVLGNPGYQDQYSAVFGGVLFIEYDATGGKVMQLSVPKDLESRLVLCTPGKMRDSKFYAVAQMEEAAKGDTIEFLHRAKKLAYEMRESLVAGDIDVVGECLHEVWLNKVKLSRHVLTSVWQEVYDLARANGAIGGKGCGSGGGGVMFFCVKEGDKEKLESALRGKGIECVSFKISHGGCFLNEQGRVRRP